MLRQICLLLVFCTLSLSACGSSHEGSAKLQTDQAQLQATIDTLQATLDASDSSGALIEPATSGATPTATAVEPTPTSPPMLTSKAATSGSSEIGKPSLSDLIVGSWLDAPGQDMLDFLPDGRFFMDSGVDYALAGDATYEVVGDNSIILTDHRYVQDNTFPIVIGDISDSSMTLVQDPWSNSERTFRKLRGANNLSAEILGLWLLVSTAQPGTDDSQADPGCIMMIFLSDGRQSGCDVGGTTYQVLSDSTIALLNPSWDESAAIRVEEIAGNTGVFIFDTSEPPVSYTRYRPDDQLKKRLVGLWGNGAMEFTEGGRYIENASGHVKVYTYQIFDGGFLLLDDGNIGPLLQAKFKSDDEMWICFPGQSETGALTFQCGGDSDTITRTVAP